MYCESEKGHLTSHWQMYVDARTMQPHIRLFKILVQNYWLQYAAVTASTHLLGLSTTFWNMAKGICSYLATSSLLRALMLGDKAGAQRQHSSSSQRFRWGRDQDSVKYFHNKLISQFFKGSCPLNLTAGKGALPKTLKTAQPKVAQRFFSNNVSHTCKVI